MARRHNLLIRFFAMSVVIAACSIAVTAWLASEATSGSIQQEKDNTLVTDAKIYDRLLYYAAVHPSWTDVRETVAALAKETGRRIALTVGEKVVADSGGQEASPLPARHNAVVDPLNVDQSLRGGTSTDPIDPRAVGPFRVTEPDFTRLKQTAEFQAKCYRDKGFVADVVVDEASGRPRVELRGGTPKTKSSTSDCYLGHPNPLLRTTLAETKASERLGDLVRACLARAKVSEYAFLDWRQLGTDPYWFRTRQPSGPDATQTTRCVESSRREQLTPFVAPAARLFLTAPTRAAGPDLARAGLPQITLAALGVLTVAAVAAWLVAAQLVRPIRAVTSAAGRMGDGDRAVRVTAAAKGELGELAAAFNTMSQRLEDTERQRKEMVSDIAHELRTPLSNIIGWLEAAQDGIAEPDPELVAMLLREAAQLEHIVTDLQDLAQADAGTLRLQPAELDAADLVDQVTAAHRTQAEEKGVTLTAAATSPLSLVADPTRLHQALSNLVGNAVRYTPEGGRVTVRARQDGEHVLFEVADTGVGISAEDLPHVFDRFWRAEKSRNRGTGGSGLGLAITRQLVRAQGGTVSVTSEVGQGSTFRVLMSAEWPL